MGMHTEWLTAKETNTVVFHEPDSDEHPLELRGEEVEGEPRPSALEIITNGGDDTVVVLGTLAELIAFAERVKLATNNALLARTASPNWNLEH